MLTQSTTGQFHKEEVFRAVLRLQFALLTVLFLACSGCTRLGAGSKSHDQEVTEGHELYEDNGCATCHGAEGHGDGPVTKSMPIAPRDFRNPSSFVNGYSVEQIANTIDTGLLDGNQSMPAYAHLSNDERRLLAEFVMSLRDTSKKGE